jgi:hypothetical protein
MEKKQTSSIDFEDKLAAAIFLFYAIGAGVVYLFKNAKDSVQQKIIQRRMGRQK